MHAGGAVRRNVALLIEDGCSFIGPAEGDLAAWPAALGAVSAFTLELWARPDSLAGTRDVLVSGDGRVAIRVGRVSDNTVRFTATVIDAGGTMYTASSGSVAAGAWHWVLVSLEQPNLRLWVDGTVTANASAQLNLFVDTPSTVAGPFTFTTTVTGGGAPSPVTDSDDRPARVVAPSIDLVIVNLTREGNALDNNIAVGTGNAQIIVTE